ncbi:hypothetical protein ABIB17_003817 [Arthrobacter sp. UYEF6]
MHSENYSVYAARKVYAGRNRASHKVARCPVERLMRRSGLQGVRQAKRPRTTVPGPLSQRLADLVRRQFNAPAPNCLGVADVYSNVFRMGVRGLRARCFLPPRGRLAALHHHAHSPGAGCVGEGFKTEQRLERRHHAGQDGVRGAGLFGGPLVVGEDGPEVLDRRRLGNIVESLVRELDLSVTDLFEQRRGPATVAAQPRCRCSRVAWTRSIS